MQTQTLPLDPTIAAMCDFAQTFGAPMPQCAIDQRMLVHMGEIMRIALGMMFAACVLACSVAPVQASADRHARYSAGIREPKRTHVHREAAHQAGIKRQAAALGFA